MSGKVTVCLGTSVGLFVAHIDTEDTRVIEIEPVIIMKGSNIVKVFTHVGSQVLFS